MAIVINGSGTVTGLAVGGLPDGTVDSDTLASGIDKTSISDSGDATAITIDSSENVGIGVTPESWASDFRSLQIGNGGSIMARTTSEQFLLGSNNYYDGSWKYLTTAQASQINQNNGIFDFKVAASGSADAAITWTTAMTIDNAGIVTKPTQPAFSVTKTSDQSIAPAADRQITWETEEFDVGSNFASDTFTAPVTGKYFLHAMVRIDDVDTAASYYRTGIESSNKNKYEIIRPLFTADVAYISMSVASIFDMDAGDTAEVTVRQQSGTDQVHIDDTIAYTNFCGYLLG